MEIEPNQTSKKMQLILHETIRKTMRPLVRLMLSQGINYTMLLEDLKRIFVSVAEEEFKIDGKPQTNSRITLLTGVHRKDVQRIREEEDGKDDPPNSLSAQIFGLWLGESQYLDHFGQPLPLPRLVSQGKVSFESLVASISKDFRSRPVLDEWLRLGFVSIDNNDCVRLNVAAFIPNQDLEYKLSFLAMNVHDHTSAAVSNLNHKNEPMLERCVYYDGLTKANVAQLHDLAKQSGMNAIKTINRHAATLKAAQTAASMPGRRQTDKANYRMNFGVYFYHAIDDENNTPLPIAPPQNTLAKDN
jgi:Family of unknown function (DUF6502)